MVEIDIIDIDVAHSYIKDQSPFEEKNSLLSYEYFVDETQNPSKITLLTTMQMKQHTQHTMRIFE